MEYKETKEYYAKRIGTELFEMSTDLLNMRDKSPLICKLGIRGMRTKLEKINLYLSDIEVLNEKELA